MLAKLAEELTNDTFLFELNRDGFRAIVFRGRPMFRNQVRCPPFHARRFKNSRRVLGPFVRKCGFGASR